VLHYNNIMVIILHRKVRVVFAVNLADDEVHHRLRPLEIVADQLVELVYKSGLNCIR
jgi:hypothetical protein